MTSLGHFQLYFLLFLLTIALIPSTFSSEYAVGCISYLRISGLCSAGPCVTVALFRMPGDAKRNIF